MRHARRIAAVALVWGLAFGAAGCLGRSPVVEHYILGAPAPARSGASAPDVAVLVGPVRLPSYLDRPQIARLGEAGAVELDEFARWLGGFEENLLRGIALELARRTGSDRIVTAPSKAPFPFDAQIRLHVDDFVAAPGPVLRVRVRWALVRPGGAAPAELYVMEEVIPLADAADATLVAAHESAVRDLAGRIATALAR